MKYYVGIDLGTTNSAIASFDGENVRVWKSKSDQNDVTPSAIYVDRRGKRFYGSTAYRKSAQQPERCATLFKRFMGTSTKIKLGDEELLPEECSAEILRELYRNLPEEIRTCDETATVITVPAAFNQMQNAATLEAAKLAGIGHVAVMQEPVAAIMSVMKENDKNAKFLIYDLGGGTLDVAIAECLDGKVNLLAHGGIAMCGGRDFDRVIMEHIVIPWLQKNYDLPIDFKNNKKYEKLIRIASYASEIAKLGLSSDTTADIEGETGMNDESGEEIYLDIPITRDDYDPLIAPMIDESIQATKDAIQKAGLTPADMDRIVFVGGLTNYKPIRDKVSEALGIPGSIEVNPMTAVAQGASIYAEAIDWTSNEHGRKSTRSQMKSAESLGLEFKYIARTTKDNAKIGVILREAVQGYTYEIKSVETGWNSGRLELKNKSMITVPLSKKGENRFVVTVNDNYERPVPLANDTIRISRTFATVEAILASHSIGIEVQDLLDSHVTTLDYLVREGDTLPAKGTKIFRANQTIKAGSTDAINFKLWEGEIEDSVEDNRFIGVMQVSGEDFDFGMIVQGAEIECNYTVNDSGSISLEISIPSISEEFNSDKNFYSRQEGQLDLDHAAATINQDGKKVLERIKTLGAQTNHQYDDQLQVLAEIASKAIGARQDTCDKETLQQLTNQLLQAKKTLNQVRRDNLVDIRHKELDHLIKFYHDTTEQFADEQEKNRYNSLFSSASNAIDRKDSSFERTLQQVRYLNFDVQFKKSNDFLIKWFVWKAQNRYNYSDANLFEQLVEKGKEAIDNQDFDLLRAVIDGLAQIEIRDNEDSMDEMANIVRG